MKFFMLILQLLQFSSLLMDLKKKMINFLISFMKETEKNGLYVAVLTIALMLKIWD